MITQWITRIYKFFVNIFSHQIFCKYYAYFFQISVYLQNIYKIFTIFFVNKNVNAKIFTESFTYFCNIYNSVYIYYNLKTSTLLGIN